MKALEREIRAYAKLRDRLEAESFGQWAVVYGDDLAGIYESLEAAAVAAVERFGRGPFLIEQIGEDPGTLNIPTVWRVFNADD